MPILIAEAGAGESMTQAARDALRRVDSVLSENSQPLKNTIANLQVFSEGLARTEAGAFGIADVASGVHAKLVRRHPHVFGDVDAETPDAVVTNWEQIKKGEKGHTSLVEGITPQSAVQPEESGGKNLLRSVARRITNGRVVRRGVVETSRPSPSSAHIAIMASQKAGHERKC